MHEILHVVQNDKHGIFMIPTQSLEGEEVEKIRPKVIRPFSLGFAGAHDFGVTT